MSTISKREGLKLLSIIISVFNEEENISPLHKQLIETLKNLPISYELIFVNDGSSDNSLAEMLRLQESDQNVHIVNFTRNFGHEIAMTAGSDYAKGDVLIFMDSDLQHPPHLIAKMVERWLNGIDVVITRRVDNEDDSGFKKLISKIFYKFLNFLSEVEIAGGYPDFRLIDRRYIDRIKQISERDRLFRGILHWIGIRNYEVIDFIAPKRIYGQSKYSLLKYANLGINAILQFSVRPLRVITLSGFAASAISICYALFIVFDHIIFNRPNTGFSTTITLMVILFSVQITVIGVIGEYVGRIHLETKKRPLYFADIIKPNQQNQPSKF